MDSARQRARLLRRNATNVERLLWQRLRFWHVNGCKFRRQQPLGSYIVDFVCLERRLIIELDGGQHAEQSKYDTERDAWLRDQGFVVMRCWNNDVLTNVEGVLEVIMSRLQSTRYLNPSPPRGKEADEKVETTPLST